MRSCPSNNEHLRPAKRGVLDPLIDETVIKGFDRTQAAIETVRRALQGTSFRRRSPLLPPEGAHDGDAAHLVTTMEKVPSRSSSRQSGPRLTGCESFAYHGNPQRDRTPTLYTTGLRGRPTGASFMDCQQQAEIALNLAV
jgi:hypothetical protein